MRAQGAVFQDGRRVEEDEETDVGGSTILSSDDY